MPIYSGSMNSAGKCFPVAKTLSLIRIGSTSLDITPKVNGKQIDLHRLFQVVQARNGYDEVSREKLLWRKIGAEFNLGQTNAAAYAFALKSTFYKYLAYGL